MAYNGKISRINSDAVYALNDLIGKGKIPETGFRVVNILIEKPNITREELAFILNRNYKTACRVLDSLVEHGFVTENSRRFSVLSNWTILYENNTNNIYNNINNNDTYKLNNKKETLKQEITTEDLEYAAKLFDNNGKLAGQICEIVADELSKTGQKYSRELFLVTAEYCAEQYKNPGMRHQRGLKVVWNAMGYFRETFKHALIQGYKQFSSYARKLREQAEQLEAVSGETTYRSYDISHESVSAHINSIDNNSGDNINKNDFLVSMDEWYNELKTFLSNKGVTENTDDSYKHHLSVMYSNIAGT